MLTSSLVLGLLTGFLACGGQLDAPQAVAVTDRSPADGPAFDLGRGKGQTVTRLLDRLVAADLHLCPSNLPPSSDQPQHFVLKDGWRPVPQAPGSAWSHPSPVHYDRAMFGTAPTSLSLSSGDKPLAFDGRIAQDPSLDRRWMLVDDTIYLASHKDPATWDAPPVLSHAPVVQREAGWNLSTSDADPSTFARRSIELDQVTEPCLFLPAPSTATLDLQIPDQGGQLVLEAGLAVPAEAPATATASLLVSIDGKVIDRTTVAAGAAWSPVAVDLASWAGRSVTLSLSTDPGPDATRDYVCVGNPRLVQTAPADLDPVRVVVVGIDTLRADHLGLNGYDRDTSPHLDALAQQSVLFARTWSPAPRTRPSFRTSTTGRWPLRAIGATDMGSVLSAAGFATAGVVANVHLAPRLGFAQGFDHYSYDNGATADLQVGRALRWLGTHQAQDSFLFLHLMDPHIFYLAPEPYRDQFTAGLDRGQLPDQYNRWMVNRWQQAGELSDNERAFITARYDGEVAFTDAQLGRLADGLDALPGRTLLIIHSDHGEELWDHGGFEHNHTLYDELTRTLLLVRPPGGRATGLRRAQPVSLADLAPTVYQALGLPQDTLPPVDGTSLWALIDPGAADQTPSVAAALDQRPLHQGYLMFDTERWSVVARQADGPLHKYVLVTTTGQQQLFNLDRDPAEQHDLATASDFDPTPWTQALAQATSWPVGPGWRVHLDLLTHPLSLSFDQPVQAAGVIDPEAGRVHRANLEWGETPALLPSEVATVTLSEDGHTVQIQPGSRGKGIVYILGPTATSQARQGDKGTSVQAGGVINAAGVRAHIEAGIVIAPTETEAAALAAAASKATTGAGPTEQQLGELRSLGYMEE